MADAGPLVMAIGRIASDAEVSLEMRDIKIGAGGAAALANALKGNRKLTAADLYNAGGGEGGVEALAAAMADGHGRVSVLDVGCNDLSLAGATALARLIRARPLGTWEEPDEYGGPARQVLHELRLARNEVDAQACAALVSAEYAEGGGGGGGGGEGAPLLLTLRSLALSFNPLGDSGAAPLGRALPRCRRAPCSRRIALRSTISSSALSRGRAQSSSPANRAAACPDRRQRSFRARPPVHLLGSGALHPPG